MRLTGLVIAVATISVLVAPKASGQRLLRGASALSGVSVDISSPTVTSPSAVSPHKVGDCASRRGVLLRSNVGLAAAQVSGSEVGYPINGELRDIRFTTTNHISLGYGWRKDFAPTVDGFRMVVPHRPNSNEIDKFEMRVDAEALGIGFGTTSFYRPLSLHIGQAIGYVMGRVGGGLLDSLRYKGFGGIAFIGYELMRSERIGIVLSAQTMNVLLFDGSRQLALSSFGGALGVTYW